MREFFFGGELYESHGVSSVFNEANTLAMGCFSHHQWHSECCTCSRKFHQTAASVILSGIQGRIAPYSLFFVLSEIAGYTEHL